VAKPETASRFETLWPTSYKSNMTSKSKPGVEFKYGGRLFSATGSSNISAVD